MAKSEQMTHIMLTTKKMTTTLMTYIKPDCGDGVMRLDHDVHQRTRDNYWDVQAFIA